MEKQNKVALVVEGGAMRGIFSAGILDTFIKHEFNPFNLCIGVSAGANNITSFLANMYKRSYKVYTDYNLRKEFINWKKFMRGGHLLDLDWLWDVTIKEIPIDKNKIVESKSEFVVGVTEVKTGKVKYITPTSDNIEDVLKASSCIPGFYREFITLGDEFFVDGGIADPIPFQEAINRGSDIVIVLRSRPYHYQMKQKNNWAHHIYFRKHPHLKKSIINRPQVYNETIDAMRNNKEVKIIEVNPKESFKTKRLTRDINLLNQDYQMGVEMGYDLMETINDLLSE